MTDSTSTLSDVIVRMMRKELIARGKMVRMQTEALRQRDERIAELEAMLADSAWIMRDIQR